MYLEFGEATVITVFTGEQPNAFCMLNNNLERGILNNVVNDVSCLL